MRLSKGVQIPVFVCAAGWTAAVAGLRPAAAPLLSGNKSGSRAGRCAKQLRDKVLQPRLSSKVELPSGGGRAGWDVHTLEGDLRSDDNARSGKRLRGDRCMWTCRADSHFSIAATRRPQQNGSVSAGEKPPDAPTNTRVEDDSDEALMVTGA